MDRTTSLSRDGIQPVRSSPMLVATVAAVMSFGAAVCVHGLPYMNTHDVLGHDFDRTPGAYAVYMVMVIGALCAPLWGVLTLASYALCRRTSRGVIRSDVVALVALAVLVSTVWVMFTP